MRRQLYALKTQISGMGGEERRRLHTVYEKVDTCKWIYNWLCMEASYACYSVCPGVMSNLTPCYA